MSILKIIFFIFIIFSCALPPKEVNYSLESGQDVIRSVLKEAIPKIRNCYESGPSVSKTFSLKTVFTINEVGNVSSLKIDKNLMDLKTLKCIRTEILLLKFPSPQISKIIEVKQPFNLYPYPN